MAYVTKNRVLRSLPVDDRRIVLEECEEADLAGGMTLDRIGEPISTVYFPETAVISTVATYSDGSTIEMANIGREGCTGIGLTLGHAHQPNSNEVQISGSALSMPAKKFNRLKAKLPSFEALLFSAVQATIYQIMVSGACNAAHNTEQRLARWLLTMSDRNDSQTMLLTQDFLAEILGLRRATISNAASRFQEKGMIAYSRGRIEITDHPALRRSSCECYELVRTTQDWLLPDATASA